MDPHTLVPDGSSVHAWLRAETWPRPKWYRGAPARHSRFWSVGDARLQRYEDFLEHQLHARYMELEGDFRTVYENFGQDPTVVDQATAARIVDLLHLSRNILEEESPDLLSASSTLDLVERYMVWMYPPHIAEARLTSMYLRVGQLPPQDRSAFTRELDLLCDGTGKLRPNTESRLRSVFDEVIGGYNRYMLQSQLGSGLQIRRLKILTWWGAVLLCVLLLASPLAVAPGQGYAVRWPYVLAGMPRELSWRWLGALTVTLFGALGGFLSALLQARNARVSLAEYQANMLRLQLKIWVGAIVSLLLYVLLAWKIVPGISIEVQGMYLLVGFISGFSERYFLKLLDLKEDEAEESGTRLTSAVADGGAHAAAAATQAGAAQRISVFAPAPTQPDRTVTA